MAKKSTTRKVKTSSKAPGAPGHNSGDDAAKPGLTDTERRELFASHRQAWNEWQAKQAVVDKIGKDVKAALKGDGFTIKHMQIADDLMDAAGEAKVKAEVQDRLQVALWIGHPMGAQLDLFAQRLRRRLQLPDRGREHLAHLDQVFLQLFDPVLGSEVAVLTDPLA